MRTVSDFGFYCKKNVEIIFHQMSESVLLLEKLNILIIE